MAQTIGQAAKATGIAARTIRFYEAAGVLPEPDRTPSGYRRYSPDAVRRLLFVRRARVLGLSLPQLRTLLTTIEDGRGPARPRVREVLRAHLASVQGQLRELRVLEAQLAMVLSRMKRPSPGRPPGPCPCLDVESGPTPRRGRDTRPR